MGFIYWKGRIQPEIFIPFKRMLALTRSQILACLQQNESLIISEGSKKVLTSPSISSVQWEKITIVMMSKIKKLWWSKIEDGDKQKIYIFNTIENTSRHAGNACHLVLIYQNGSSLST